MAKDGYGSGSTGRVTYDLGNAPPELLLANQVKQHGAAYVAALYGFVTPPPPGAQTPPGCEDLATGRVYSAYGSVNKSLASELATTAIQYTQSDRRVVVAEAAWSACMAARGFQYPTPLAPVNASWPTPPSPAEIATAEADISCKEATDLTGIAFAILSGYQAELVQRNIAALSELNKDFSAVLQNAETIVRNGK